MIKSYARYPHIHTFDNNIYTCYNMFTNKRKHKSWHRHMVSGGDICGICGSITAVCWQVCS